MYILIYIKTYYYCCAG